MLPRDFPPRSTVYGYFWRWRDDGTWSRVHGALYRRCRDLQGREESPTAAIIDSQSVKTGAEARDMVGFDAGKRVKGRKRHIVTDTLGLLLRVEVHSAGVQDRDGAALVFDRLTERFPFLKGIFADAGCQGPRVAAVAPRPVEIIRRSDRGFVVQPMRVRMFFLEPVAFTCSPSSAPSHGVCARLMSIPGVGALTALIFPRRYQSGETDVMGRISRAGDGMVRAALHEAANSMLTRSLRMSALRAWALDVTRRRGHKRTLVALARKLAVVMHRMWLDGTTFQWSRSRAPAMCPAAV